MAYDDFGDEEEDYGPDDMIGALPFPQVVAKSTPLPSDWRQCQSPREHHITWIDSSNMSHTHIIRADTLDEAVLEVRKIKLVIDSLRAKEKTQRSQQPAPPSQSSTPVPDEYGPTECPIHHVPMPLRDGSYGKFRSHKTSDGGWCSGKAK